MSARGVRAARRAEVRAAWAQWAAARTLTDLGELTALWLAGELPVQPDYDVPVDTDERYAPGMTAAMITACRHGYVTRDSQAGYDAIGYDGARWWQLPAVKGYATPEAERRLVRLRHLGYRVIVHHGAGRERWPGWDGYVVTWRAGHPTYGSGQRMTGRASPGSVRWDLAGCHPDAVRQALGAAQVTVIDPRGGRRHWHDLWRDLPAAFLTNDHVKELTRP